MKSPDFAENAGHPKEGRREKPLISTTKSFEDAESTHRLVLGPPERRVFQGTEDVLSEKRSEREERSGFRRKGV